MIARRQCLLLPARLIATRALRAEQAVYLESQNLVVRNFTVSDSRGRNVAGLDTGDLPVFEDDSARTIAVFAAPGKAPRVLNPAAGLDMSQVESAREDIENGYAVAYQPTRDGPPESFLRLRIEIVHRDGAAWRIRHQVGYRH